MTDHTWIKYDPSVNVCADYMYGFHADWIHADACPDGVREISYEGDHYVSCFWCMAHDEWHSTSTALDEDTAKPQQPTHVMKRFPVPVNI